MKPMMKQKVSAAAIAVAAGLGFLLTPAAIAQSQDDLEQLLDTGYCPSCDLSGFDLSGQDLSNAYLPGAFLLGTDLSNANLRGANLSRALLNGANLSGVDFSQADLTDASLQGARMPVSAIFTGAEMERMILPNGRIYSDPTN